VTEQYRRIYASVVRDGARLPSAAGAS